MTTNSRSERIHEYREMSIRADELALAGKTDEALQLLEEYRAKASEANDLDYQLYYEAEHIEYSQPAPIVQIELLQRALSWAKECGIEDDYFLFYALGVYNFKLGEFKVAMNWFDRSLALNPDDNRTLREKASLLANIRVLKNPLIEKLSRLAGAKLGN